jgi:hypothetical protein
MNKSKTLSLSFVILISITSCKIFEGTGDSKKAEEEIQVDCYAADFRTDTDYFRATSSAYDNDEMLSQEKALLYAKKAVVSKIRSVVSASIARYFDESPIGQKKNYKEVYLPKINSKIKEVLNQELTDYNVICKSKEITERGVNRTDISIEVSKRTIVAFINSRLSSGSPFSELFDPIKFEQILNDELKKVADAQKNEDVKNLNK